jgi:hypothetical protein
MESFFHTGGLSYYPEESGSVGKWETGCLPSPEGKITSGRRGDRGPPGRCEWDSCLT